MLVVLRIALLVVLRIALLVVLRIALLVVLGNALLVVLGNALLVVREVVLIKVWLAVLQVIERLVGGLVCQYGLIRIRFRRYGRGSGRALRCVLARRHNSAVLSKTCASYP